MSNFFTSVIQNDHRFTSVDRINDLALLEPVTRRLVQKIITNAKSMGIELMVFETYRSKARQEQFFNQGVTQLRKVGVHHYGLACDIVKSINGEPSWKGDFSFLGQMAHAGKLIWGGDWGNPNIPHSFIDVVHVQRCSLSKQPSLFNGDWYPSDEYNPYITL